jgi:hypothetical protein
VALIFGWETFLWRRRYRVRSARGGRAASGPSLSRPKPAQTTAKVTPEAFPRARSLPERRVEDVRETKRPTLSVAPMMGSPPKKPTPKQKGPPAAAKKPMPKPVSAKPFERPPKQTVPVSVPTEKKNTSGLAPPEGKQAEDRPKPNKPPGSPTPGAPEDRAERLRRRPRARQGPLPR